MIPAALADYRLLARAQLPRQLFDYIDGGSYDEVTLAANRRDLLALRLRQQVLRDVSTLDTGSVLLGSPVRLPVALAPVGLAGLFARRGEVAAAQAAEAAGVPFCLSTVSLCSIEEVRAAVQAPFWFQLYMMKDRGVVRALLQRAQAAQCSALVVTVDLAVLGARYRDTRNGMAGSTYLVDKLARAIDIARHPGWLRDVAIGGRPLVFGNLADVVPSARMLSQFAGWVASQFDASVTWKDLDWIRAQWRGPLIIKGVLDVADARAAAALGATALIVSNHGGRQLDSAPSAIAALPPIVDAVGDRLEVMMDGGVHSGQDVVKALALGARAALLGRAWVYALAAGKRYGGGAGVAALLARLRREMEVTMALQGVTAVAQIGRDAILASGPACA